MVTESNSSIAERRPSVEPLLLRAADVLESHLRLEGELPSSCWCRETMNGVRAISLLSRIWTEFEVKDNLERLNRSSRGRSLRHSIAVSAVRLQALVGAAELQIGGLEPEVFPEDHDDGTIGALRLSAWRIVAGIAVLHAFLCLLRSREPSCRIAHCFAIV